MVSKGLVQTSENCLLTVTGIRTNPNNICMNTYPTSRLDSAAPVKLPLEDLRVLSGEGLKAGWQNRQSRKRCLHLFTQFPSSARDA